MATQAQIKEQVTAKIIEALESGVTPWVRPWKPSKHSGSPTNILSGRPYRGINWLLLSLPGHSSKWWGTFNQWRGIGVSVKRGEKGTGIVLFKPVTKEVINEQGDKEVEKYGYYTTFTVFHISQVEGDISRFTEEDSTPSFPDYEPAENLISSIGANIRHGGSESYYSPTKDYIRVPYKSAFIDAESYYSTVFHELIHYTGHETRLNRLNKFERFGSESYALEELVAEIGAAFLCSHLGVPFAERNTAAYLDHWLKILKKDSSAIFLVTSAASKACDYLLSFSDVESEEVAC